MQGVVQYLGIEATSRGFCFAVLEDTERLIDWGCREMQSSSTGIFIDKLGRIIDRYRADVLVIEDPAGSLKGEVVKIWLSWAEEYANEIKIKAVAVSKEDFLAVTSTYGSDKHEMAQRLSRLFPKLEDLVPPPRKTWESERRRTGIFVALERALLVARRRQDKAS